MKKSNQGNKGDDKNIYSLQSAERILDVLQCFTSDRTDLSLAEISALTSINKTTLFRILHTLARRDFIAFNDFNKTYSLGAGILTLYNAVSWASRMEEICLPQMRFLRDKTGETITLYRMDGYKKYCVLCVESLYPLRRVIRAGESFPLYVNATGRSLLSQMDDEELARYLKEEKLIKYTESTVTQKTKILELVKETRNTGYCISIGESHEGVCAIAAPLPVPAVFGRYSMALVIPTIRYKKSSVQSWVRDLKDTCSKITSKIFNAPHTE